VNPEKFAVNAYRGKPCLFRVLPGLRFPETGDVEFFFDAGGGVLDGVGCDAQRRAISLNERPALIRERIRVSRLVRAARGPPEATVPLTDSANLRILDITRLCYGGFVFF
jgi:hypothetical protein